MSNEGKKQLKKFFMEYRTKSGEILQYQQEAVEGKLESVSFPYDVLENTPDSLKMQMFKDGEKSYDLPPVENVIEFSQALVKRGNKEKADEVKDSQFEDCQVWKDLAGDYFENGSGDFPSLSYADVTEKVMFGYPEIRSDILSSQSTGVWANYGYRIFHITIKDLPKLCANQKVMVSMLWYRIGSEELSVPLCEEEIRGIATADAEKYEFEAYVDTHKLGELFKKENIETNGADVDGRFEVHINETNGEDNKVYSFPVRIFVKNTFEKEICSTNDVSIDFGTSATCAAVTWQNKERLITLSGSGKCEDGNVRYENPTNVMVYNWEELWRQWSDDNNYFPFFLTKKKDESEKYADYDSGYTVERIFRAMGETDMGDGRRKAEAVLKELKMIPFNLQQGQDMRFRSYNGDNRPIGVVDDWQKQNENNFDPVAFYGYLLGRAINNPGQGELFLKYHITYPEKFDPDVKEKLKNALTYGLKRSLPLPLRKFVQVETKYSEPVACIGTILKHYVHLDDENPKPKFFAVYDLGGGTMDFALAVLRSANGKEQEDDYEDAVTLLGVDGDGNIGGEPLIHKLAYKLYLDSKEEMENNKIKFFLPYGENRPEGFEDILSTKRDEISEINVNLMKENLARKLFEHEEEVNGNLADLSGKAKSDVGGNNGAIKDAHTYEMKLRGSDNEEKEVSIEVKEVDEFLREKIKETIEKFKDFIETNLNSSKEKFSQYGIDIPKLDDVQIFLSGNASKQHYVNECLKEVFGDNVNIVRIGEKEINSDKENKQYWVNEKTAVAFGQLSLLKNSGRFLDGLSETPRFQYTVGYEKDNGQNIVLRHGTASDDHNWYRANRVGDDGQVRLFYITGMEEAKTIPWSFIIPQDELQNGKILYLRIHDHRSVEYTLGKLKDGPKDCAEVVESHIVEVGKGLKENKEVE